MLWINFLHLYQPANSPSYRIKEAVEKSYWRITDVLEKHHNLHFTFNISACLLERLRDEGYGDLLQRWKLLIQSGRLELVGSAAYHAFLPFLPESEVDYQITRQEEIIKEILGVDVKGGGFFLPEMAYTPALAKLIKKRGYSWLILDEASLVSKKYIPVAIDENSGLKVVIRERLFSNTYLPDLINQTDETNLASVIITATDAELYGLRHEDPEQELEKMLSLKNLSTQSVSVFLAAQSELKTVTLKAASWESDLESNAQAPFIIWRNPKNKIQTDLWLLAELALELGQGAQKDKNYYWYRWHLDRGLASCMFWWASAKDFSHNFGPIAWSPDEVEAGLNDLIRSIRALASASSLKYKLKTEKIANRLRYNLWRRHWQKHWLASDKND
ncbi:MAG: hypothetical protein RBT30_01410 [Patescibacteria group bacterium]|jgi:predicted glycosyl hydrolase (DUF1957 family)|nr:hypothetical protein [Patescibacteria group bacterium]